VKKSKSLRRRWLINTVSVVCALGLVCVLAVTGVFAEYYYSAMESDLSYRARTTTEFFADYLNQSYNAYYQSCINYAQSFDEKDRIELQFINAQGRIVASSYGPWAGQSPTTSDISRSMKTQKITTFVGTNPQTGERIMAVSSPMRYSNGEVIGVLRYVTSTAVMDRQVLQVGLIAVSVLLVILAIVVISGNYYMRYILVPLTQVVEKAKKITSGSYGIQIEKRHDDEMGQLVDAINEMSLKISQNEKMQTDFISSLSHELRTPLTAITGWSETILGGETLDEGVARGVKIIHKEAGALRKWCWIFWISPGSRTDG